MNWLPPRALAAATVAGLLLSSLFGCGQGINAQNTPPPKKTSDAANAKTPAKSGGSVPKAGSSGPSSRTTTQPARIEAFETTPLFPKISGFVKTLHGVDIGDRITDLTQPLVTLLVPEMLDEEQQKLALESQAKAEVEQAAAAVTLAKSRLDAAKAHVEVAVAGLDRSKGACKRWTEELKRIKGLAGDGSIARKIVDETQFQYDSSEAACKESQAKIDAADAARGEADAAVKKAQADHRAALARVKVAEANRNYTQTMLKYAVIRAPFPGVITERNVDTGHFVRPGDSEKSRPLFVIARTDVLRVFVDVPERDAPFISRGNNAVIRVPALGAKTQFPLKVTRTSYSLNPRNRTLRVEIDIKNPPTQLRPGMYATAEISLSAQPSAD